MNYERKLLGTVGVDSGQLMIVDPSYVPMWVEPENATLLGLQFWGRDAEEAAARLEAVGRSVEHKGAGVYLLPQSNRAWLPRLEGELAALRADDGLLIVWRPITDGSYDAICDATGGDTMGSEVLRGLAVAFRSGFGDGSYEVWAYIGDYGRDLGKRVAKVEILMIDDAEVAQFRELVGGGS